MTRARVLAGTGAAATAALVLWFGGIRAAVYFLLYLLALAPGLPLGWRLFGRRHPSGWVAGGLIGYALTALVFWIPVRLGVAHAATFVLVWCGLTAGLWWRARRAAEPLVPLPRFTARDAALWLLTLHLVLVLLALPFGRLGERDASGTRYYRAYFTADFVWHMALTRELAHFDWPPRNPYLAPEPIHYYWAYFLVPAVLAGPSDAPLVPVDTALKVTALGTGLLMVSLIFFAAWAACARAGPAAAATLVALAAPSFEGLYATVDLWRRHVPFDALREDNIDAISNWVFHGLRVDGLARSMWYTPQHSISFALGLVAVIAASRLPRSPRLAAWPLTGVALALSVMMNPFLGAAFCVIYGATVMWLRVRGAADAVSVTHLALAAAPVLLALGWTAINGMNAGAASDVTIGWTGDARNAPLFTLFLSLGGLLIPALVGALPWRTPPLRFAFPAVAAAVLGLFLMYFVTLTDPSWVGFRAGNILQATLPLLVARGLAGLTGKGRTGLAATLVVVVLAAGAPTTIIDAYNAQDTGNRRMGPGFLWTIPISPAQQAGFDWIRRNTPPAAVVQADPIVRGRQNWSIIPSFTGRRMAAGEPISLLPDPRYEERSRQVHAIITTLAPEDAHERAKALHIDYLWIDADDRAGTTARQLNRFRARPDLFTPVFSSAAVTIYRVD